MPPTKVVKPSRSNGSSSPEVASASKPNVKDEANDSGLDISAASEPSHPAPAPAPTPAGVQRPRVLSISQAMVKGDISGNTVLSSQWFTHPDCSLGLWWRIAGQLKGGRLKMDLVAIAFNVAVDVALCAVQVRLTQKTVASGSVSSSCVPFKRATTTLSVTTGKELLVPGCDAECSLDGLDSLVLSMSIAYMALPEHLKLTEQPAVGMDAMFDSKEFGAVNFVLDDGDQILAHKAVIASHSAMLRTMFAGSGTGVDSSPVRLHVSAVSKDVLTIMLRYMYTGVIKSDAASRNDMVSLLYLAERFGVTRLKHYAELALVDFVQTAESELLQVARTTNAAFLLQIILVRLSIGAGFNDSTQTDSNQEAALLTQVLRTNPDMLQDFFYLNSVAMAPMFKPLSKNNNNKPDLVMQSS